MIDIDYSILFPSSDDYKTVLIIGCMHGDEPQGKFIIDRYLKKNINSKNKLIFIPCLNFEGVKNNTRVNKNGVDLNRNYPTSNWIKGEKDSYFGGDSPASEDETKFIIDNINKYSPNAILTLHAPYEVVNYDGDAIELAEKVSELSGYPVQENIGYPTPGSFGTYAGVERNIPVITLELSEEDSLDNLYSKVEKVIDYLAFCY